MAINKSLEECVKQHAADTPSKVAVVNGHVTITYSQLWDCVCKRKSELEQKGLKQGQLHIFKTTQDADFLANYMAAHLIGVAAVPLGQDCPEQSIINLKEKYSETRFPYSDGSLENISDVLFTTGSTGKQKGVMESYRAIIADADNLVHAQGFTKDTVFVICGPLNHIGSLSKVWPVLILGGTLIILQGMKDMEAFFHAFDYNSDKLATFLVPASIRIILQFGADRLKSVSDKIDFIETGGAAISQHDMEELCRLMPNVRLYNTYASTETGIVCTYDYNHNATIAGCTGRPMLNSQVFITAEGTIACKGKTLMSGYLGDHELPQEVLHDGTVFTSDLGEIDAEGCLHIKGRNNDVINIGGYKVSPLEIEDAAMAFPYIADCICFMAHSQIFGDTIKLVYTAKDSTTISKKDLARFLASKLEKYKLPRIFEQAPSIKHTFNGKVDRKYYSL